MPRATLRANMQKRAADTPPDTIEDLRQLMLAIGRGESDIHLGPKTRAALGHILELQGDPAVLSITALAERLDVSPSTITRLARSLGYAGFAGFQRVLVNASLNAPGAFYSRQAQAALAGDEGHLKTQARRLCRENQANIDRFIEGLDADAFSQAVHHIAHARRIAVHGARQFHSFASFLVYGLGMIRADVGLLDAAGSGPAEGLAALSGGDVLIVASCAPYTASVVEVFRAGSAAGLTTIAVTDRASSPLVSCSGTALFVPHRTSFLSNSMTAYIACAECLINACATALGDKAAQALAVRERFIRHLGIET